MPEDLQEMTRRLEQEALLYRTGFAPVLEGGSELFIRTGAEHPELYTRSRALVSALEELTALDRGYRSHAGRLTSENATDEGGER